MSVVVDLDARTILDEQTESCYINLPRQIVCKIHCEDAIYPPATLMVRYDPSKPNQLNYLSYSIGQSEKERQWDGVILLSSQAKLVLHDFLAICPEAVHLALAP